MKLQACVWQRTALNLILVVAATACSGTDSEPLEQWQNTVYSGPVLVVDEVEEQPWSALLAVDHWHLPDGSITQIYMTRLGPDRTFFVNIRPLLPATAIAVDTEGPTDLSVGAHQAWLAGDERLVWEVPNASAAGGGSQVAVTSNPDVTTAALLSFSEALALRWVDASDANDWHSTFYHSADDG